MCSQNLMIFHHCLFKLLRKNQNVADYESQRATRAVRGSDYSPTTELSEEKDKLIPENWRDREKKNQNIIPKPHAHLHSIQKTFAVSKQMKENCKRSCAQKVPTAYML